jgi:coenzyme F420-reducing hydrogenase alpha subunit
MPHRRTIRVDYLARVEGAGALTIRFTGDRVRDVELSIFEPPRFFEAFLRGRAHTEVPDITARICGICPVAYQMSSSAAIESALGVEVGGQIRALRRLLYCGEWVESHALHMFLLHAPDFLGYPDALTMAKDHPEMLRRGLRIKKAGNAIVATLGGREIHPINVRVGGFHRLPTRAELDALVPDLTRAREEMREALEWMAGFTFPEVERDYEFLAVHHPQEYPLMGDRLRSSRGLDIPVAEYDNHFVEEQVARSTALYSRRRDGGAYFCGPLARFNLGSDRLARAAREAAVAVGLHAPCANPFRGLLVRGVETIHALDEALRLIAAYDPPSVAAVEAPARAGTGHGCTEAPRGVLYHRYRLDAAGTIEDAKIVPPTSQNQRVIEEDLWALAPRLGTLAHDAATLLAEQAVRNYDPCISCATHFLTLRVERE